MVRKGDITLTVGVWPPPLNPLRLRHSVYFPSNCVSLFLHCPSPCLPTPHFSLYDHTLFPSLWSSPSLQNLSDWRSLSNLPCALARPAPPNGPSVPAPTVLVIPKQTNKKKKINQSQSTNFNVQSKKSSYRNQGSQFSLQSFTDGRTAQNTDCSFFCEFKFLPFFPQAKNDLKNHPPWHNSKWSVSLNVSLNSGSSVFIMALAKNWQPVRGLRRSTDGRKSGDRTMHG